MQIKVPYLTFRQKKDHRLYYWQPKKYFVIRGEVKPCPFPVTSLGRDLDAATQEANRLNKCLKEWRSGLTQTEKHIKKHSVDWVIADFKCDEKYLQLKAGTQKFYGYYLPEISRVFGDLLPAQVTRQHARMFYRTYREQARKAESIMTVARIIFGHAVDLGLSENNPFKEQRVKKPPPRQTVWTQDLIERFKEKALEIGQPSMALAMQMAYDLGQRPQDLRAMGWSQWNDGSVCVKQQKTGELVEVKALKDLREMLDSHPKESPIILIHEVTGNPYSKDTLSRRFRDICEQAGIPSSYQLRDLRRTAVVRLAEAGCSVPEICAITGHKLQDANTILEVYLPRNTAMARSGIAKLEGRE